MEHIPISPILYRELPASYTQQNFVYKYYNVFGYTTTEDTYQEKTLPNGFTSLVFHLGKKINVSNVCYNGNDLPQHYLFGKYTDLIKVNHSFGEVDTFGVIFKPGAFRHFIPESQKVFTNKVVDVRDAFGKSFLPYLHMLEDSSSLFKPFDINKILDYRKGLMEKFFAELLSKQSTTEGLIDDVLASIKQNPQGVSLKGICQKFNISQQHLNREFNRGVGMSVYRYARIIRFNHLIRTYDQMRVENLLQLVVDFDYHDISHLVKDFRKFTGDSPSEFLNSENKLARFLMHR